jgi:hypothetical protein
MTTGAPVSDTDGELRRAVDRLTSSIEQLRTELVRKDVYESDQRARDQAQTGPADDLRELKADVVRNENARQADRKADEDRQLANRRLILTSLAFPILLILIQLYIASRFGGTA